MFKYKLGQEIFAIHENKIKIGRIMARKNIENLKVAHNIFVFDDNGIYYRVAFEGSKVWDYKEENIFNTAEKCVEYISK